MRNVLEVLLYLIIYLTEYKDEENVMKNIKVVYVIGPEVSGEQGILRKISDMDKRHSRKPHSATPSVPVIVHPTSFTNNIQSTQNPVFQMAGPVAFSLICYCYCVDKLFLYIHGMKFHLQTIYVLAVVC